MIHMSNDKHQSKKLEFELKLNEGKVFIHSLSQYTDVFFQKKWFDIVKELFNQTQVQKINSSFILFKQTFLLKDLKIFMQTLEHKLRDIRFSCSQQVYLKGLKENLQRVMNIKINIPGKYNSEVKKIPYKDFILCYDFIQLTEESNTQSQISFEAINSKGFRKPQRQVVLPRGRHRHFQKENEVLLNLPKIQLLIFYAKEDHSKINQVLNNMQQYRQQWLLYPMNPYLNQFSLDRIYYEELIQKILIKRSQDLKSIVQKFNFEHLDRNIKLLKDDAINHNRSDPAHPNLQEGFFLGFHLFGQSKHYYQFYLQLDEYLQSCRMWILRPEKICCCQTLANLEEYMKESEGLQTFLISDHIVVIIKSKEDMDNLTSIQNRQKLMKQNVMHQEERLLKLLQTGIFVLDINDYDQQDLQHVYKEKQGYKKYLEKQYKANITYTPETTRLRICVKCQISAFRVFKGCIYSYINDMRRQKEELPEFSSPFHRFLFETYLREDIQKQFPDVKFYIKKRKNIERLWVRFHAKDRSSLIDRLQQLRKEIQCNLDYIVSKKQPISQNWFVLYRRPQILSIQTLTCRKYLISKDTKIYVQPYQSLSRQVDEMLFLIDQSFQNCWQFTEIAEQNDINLMSLFLEFQQKKKKKPDRIKSIPLSNHRYINRMVLWYNDMLKKIQNRREQDIKKLYKRYEDKREMHIMIPRHASTNVLLHFVLPSLIKEFTQQTGYNLKQIFFYYSILFDDKHSFVEDLTLKIIDEEMRKSNIQLQNENYLTKDTVQKIIQMEYITLHCMFDDDQRVWKASNLSSYVFFIERQILKQRKYLSNNLENIDEKRVPNFKVPLFFMDTSFNVEILVDLVQKWFYKVNKHSVEGPFEIKLEKRYEQIAKCITCIRNIFRSLSYVVFYVDKDFNVSKNGYYYSHKHYLAETNQEKYIIEDKNKNYNFKKSKTQSQMNENKVDETKNTEKVSISKFTIFPMKLQIYTSSNKRNHYEQCGKIIKRESRKLAISIIQSSIEDWFMIETHNENINKLMQYLTNANNYKNNENFLLEEISQYSIFDLKDEMQHSKILDLEDEIKQQLSKNNQQSVFIQNSFSIDSLDLSLISSIESCNSNSTKHISILSQLNISNDNKSNTEQFMQG